MGVRPQSRMASISGVNVQRLVGLGQRRTPYISGSMTSDYGNNHYTFSPATRASFLQYLHDNPNNRRISEAERLNLIGWLTNPSAPSASQTESSRRNYVRKSFTWDKHSQTLISLGKKEGDKNRVVVTEDLILDVVERVHIDHGHPGWDTTWRAVHDSYYGILRADVIFLLKQCEICAQNPRKRPKGSTDLVPKSELANHDTSALMSTLSIEDLLYDPYSTSGVPRDDPYQGGRY